MNLTFPGMTEMTYVLSTKTNSSDGTGKITFTDAPASGDNPGTWGISDPTGIASQVVIVLKQSNSWAAFLVSALSGNWTTSGPGRSTQGLSHADVWYKPGDTTDVPLPATLPLVLAGLGGLGLLTRRRRAA